MVKKKLVPKLNKLSVLMLCLALVVLMATTMLAIKKVRTPREPGTLDPGIFTGFSPIDEFDGLETFETTSIEGVAVARQDQRSIDGDFVCHVYEKTSGKILATSLIKNKYTPDGQVITSVEYSDSGYDRTQLEAVVAAYCP